MSRREEVCLGERRCVWERGSVSRRERCLGERGVSRRERCLGERGVSRREEVCLGERRGV